ncbi:MAG: coproporphyrinogen III oxidase, partial [Planctomycetaceae bacterium]|nr:coproporphyrinogen III oxidase [Planctomycetaceae bacterium]
SHTAVGACETVRRCAEVIPNLSLDLIFGVPGQTLESWRRTLDTAICLPVSHISTYGLTYESGTPFFTRRQHGRLQPVTDDVEREMYLLTIRVLAEAGFEHYEVSNFARPGFRCRHNLVYWHADEFHAFGPGAARYLNGTRSTNIKSVPRWISAWNDRQEFAIQESETLSPEDRAREALMLGLRLVEGFDVSQFELRFGCSVESLAAEALRLHLRDGMLQLNDGRLRLTSDGRLIADTIIADFL